MAKKAYVGVNNVARKVSKMYVGVGGVARKVKKAYVGVNGVAQQFYTVLPKIVTWAGGTDAEIVAMVQAADEGLINLADYWSVGDTRSVNISAIDASGSNSYGSWSVNSSQPAQTVQFVLVDSAHPYTLVNATASGRTTSSFSVQVKNCLYNGMGVHRAATACWWGTPTYAKNWCNAGFRGAIPSTLLPIFKQFKFKSSNLSNQLTTTTDYFAFFTGKEVTGTLEPSGYIYSCESSLTQKDYFKTVANRYKTCATQSLSDGYWWWWLGSPIQSTGGGNWVIVSGGSTGAASNNSDPAGYAPFGVI